MSVVQDFDPSPSPSPKRGGEAGNPPSLVEKDGLAGVQRDLYESQGEAGNPPSLVGKGVGGLGRKMDCLLERVRAQLDLDAETEGELLEELRGHLEDAIAAARARGLDEEEALAEAAAHFGVEEVGRELQATHVGWGTADGVVTAALPVVCALILRWLVFAPDGTAVGWQEVLVRPAFWVVALAALLLPLLKFPRWRYALVSWAFFWGLSVVFFAWPALRW